MYASLFYYSDESTPAGSVGRCYLWQIIREVVTEGSKGLAANSQVVVNTALVQTLTGEECY